MSNSYRLLIAIAIFAIFGLDLAAQVQPPVNLTATVVTASHWTSQVKLAWEAGDTLHNLRYNIYKKEGVLTDTLPFKKWTSLMHGTSAIDAGVRAGKSYCYYVVAVSGTTVSDPSNKVEVAVTQPVRLQGWVYGKVTADSNGAPLKRAYVNVFGVGPNYAWNIVYTDSLGNYAVKVDTGKYGVYFAKDRLVPEYFDNVTTFQAATILTVNNGDSLNANAGLALYVPPAQYTLVGQVKDAAGNPLKANISLFKLHSNTFHIGSAGARTDSLGNYSVKVYDGDTVVVYAQPANRLYLPQYYNNKTTFNEADRIGVTGNVTGIDFVLALKPVYPNGISGVVTDTNNAGVKSHVEAYRLKSATATDARYAVVSDSLGQYAFTNLLPGKYILLAVPQGRLRATYFKYDGTTTLNWRNADSVMVDSASLVTGINFHVKPTSDTGHGCIHGYVRNGGGKTSTVGSVVSVVDANNQIASFGIVDKNGKYIVDGLVAGSYTVSADYINFQTSSTSSVAIDYSSNIMKQQDLTIVPFTTTEVKNDVSTVSGYALYQNYPNPFNPTTMIRFTLAEKTNVKLTVYDMMGREVAQLINGVAEAGSHSVEFNATGFASGVYFYTLTGADLSITRKLVILK